MGSGIPLDAVVVLAPGAVLERCLSVGEPASARLVAGGQVAELGADLGELVARLTGARIGEVLKAALDGRGLTAAEGSRLSEQINDAVQQLVAAGFLAVSAETQPPTVGSPRQRDLAVDPPSSSAVVAAGHALRRAGFTAAHLRRLLSHPAASELTTGDRAAARHRLAAAGQAGTTAVGLRHLVAAFVLGDDIDEVALRSAVGDGDASVLIDAGLLQRDAGRLRSSVRLAAHEGPEDSSPILIASDGAAAQGRADLVPGVHRPSITLADFTPRRRVASACDMGTGNGLQALLLARHADRVVATDVNPRAVGYARLNAALNDVRLDVRLGSLLEPIDGESFDLFVSNPPYVLSPETSLVFRDSGYPGDDFNRLVATSVSSALNPGGTAVVLLSWAQPLAQREPAPLRWLAGSSDDALLVLTGQADPITEAASWNREYSGDPERYAQQIERWLAWYAEQGIEQIGYGALTLRRRPTPPPVADGWHFALPGEPRSGSCGDHVEHILLAHRRLAGLDDAALLVERVRVRPGLSVSRKLAMSGQTWVRSASIGVNPGLGVRAPVDDAQERLLTSMTATFQPIAELVDEADQGGIGFLRGLVEAGFAELDD
jgi:hypothetical protein